MTAAARSVPPVRSLSRTGRDYLSDTQGTPVQRCPLKWHFEYGAQRPHERGGAALAFGSAIHTALELHFRALLAGCTAPSGQELLCGYDQAWQADAAPPVRYGKGESARSLQAMASRVLAAFTGSPQALPGGEILGVEEELRRPILPGLPDLLARLDLIVRTDSALVIRDFKTARSRWTEANVTEAAPQLLLYGDLARPLAEELGDLAIRLEFVVLTKTRSPSVAVHPVGLDPHQLGRIRRIMTQVWHAMQTGHIYPNPSPMNCATCPFPQACRTWRG